MLSLTREIGEDIYVGGEIVVRLLSIENVQRRPRARIGIQAPADVTILRRELLAEGERVQTIWGLFGVGDA
jgi:carbon storage regulator CsrA